MCPSVSESFRVRSNQQEYYLRPPCNRLRHSACVTDCLLATKTRPENSLIVVTIAWNSCMFLRYLKRNCEIRNKNHIFSLHRGYSVAGDPLSCVIRYWHICPLAKRSIRSLADTTLCEIWYEESHPPIFSERLFISILIRYVKFTLANNGKFQQPTKICTQTFCLRTVFLN